MRGAYGSPRGSAGDRATGPAASSGAGRLRAGVFPSTDSLDQTTQGFLWLHIFVTGGVASSLGKGLTASSPVDCSRPGAIGSPCRS